MLLTPTLTMAMATTEADTRQSAADNPDADGGLLYFAYGSNLYLPRMQKRVPSAFPQTVARLPGYRLAFNKIGGEGSAKCSIVEDADDVVWGVVYRMDAAERGRLDEAEGEGYERITIDVVAPEGELVQAFTYKARPGWTGRGWPFDWYRDLVTEGARHHALPAAYVGRITAVTAVPDPDPARDRANRPRPW